MKKLSISILVIVLLFISSVSLYANGDKDPSEGVVGPEKTYSYESDTKAYADGLLQEKEYSNNVKFYTREQLAIIQEKETLAKQYNKNSVVTTSTTWTHLPDYVAYAQNTSYNCVPASVQAALNYLNGSVASQSSIASDLGTTSSGTAFSSVLPYINQEQSKNPYITCSSSSSEVYMGFCLYTGIVNWDAPPIASMRFYTKDGWPYDANGHTLTIKGVRGDQMEFRIADPWMGYAYPDDPYKMFYTKSRYDIYQAVNQRGNGFIW